MSRQQAGKNTIFRDEGMPLWLTVGPFLAWAAFTASLLWVAFG